MQFKAIPKVLLIKSNIIHHSMHDSHDIKFNIINMHTAVSSQCIFNYNYEKRITPF